MEGKVRAAIYCRVSTDLQEKEHTIQSQLEALRKYAQGRGYEVVVEYLDEGYSGATLERPGLDQLRDALHSGEFDMVLFHSPDRLARKAIYQGIVLEELEKARVKLEFLNYPVDDTPESKMLLGMQGLFAEYERAKITERNRRGKMHWAKQGALMGGYVPYGYRYIPRDRESGQRATLAIEESEATVVRDMFRWLVEEHLSCRGIAKRLTELNIPTRRGKKFWKPSAVNRMLKQEVYKGVFYYHRAEAVEPSFRKPRQGYPKYKLTGRKLRPRDEWVAIPVPAIIDEATWEAAQRQLNENFINSPRNNTKHQYLLRGLIRCAECGATYVGAFARGKRHYHCNRIDYLASADGRRCSAGWLRADPLEELVWQAVCDALRHPEALKEEYQRRLTAASKPDCMDSERDKIENTLKRAKSQQDRLTDAYLNEAIHLTQYKAKMDELREKRSQLERQLSEVDKRLETSRCNSQALVQLETFCDTMCIGLDNLTFEEKQQLLRLVVERIIVKDGKVRIETIIPLSDSVRLRPQSIHRRTG